MPELERPTVTLHYEDAGQSRDALPAIVFLHGWCDGSPGWADTIAEFSSEFRCLAPDMRGHHRSGAARDHCYSAEALSNDVVALCDSLSIEYPVLVGHSFGGYLAAEVARRFPGFARGLLIEDQPLDLRGFGAELRTLESVVRGAETHLQFRQQFLASMLTDAMPTASRKVVEDLVTNTPVDLALALWAPLFEYSADELAERSDALMRALNSQAAMTIEHADAPAYHTLLRTHAPYVATRVIRSGHWIHLERPAEFRAELRDFLSAV